MKKIRNTRILKAAEKILGIQESGSGQSVTKHQRPSEPLGSEPLTVMLVKIEQDTWPIPELAHC